jgi:prepilin-type N-terminal cleavage/methylation domain-containing protein
MLFNMKKGFTLIEVLVGAAVFLTVATAAYGAYTGIFRLANLNQARMLAVSLADEQFEMVRNMSYTNIGIINGIPSGVLPASTTLVRGGISFGVVYTVRDVDLPFDGTFGSSTNNDTSPADEKFVQVAVSCPTCQSFVPVVVTGQIAPKNLENSTNNGALFVQTIDANGNPVVGASIHVSYTATTSPIIIDDTTNNSGMLQLVDIPPATQAYSITATKSGYSSDQTYVASSTNPNPYKVPATVVAQQLTQISLSIDKSSTLNINSTGPTCIAAPNFHFSLTGSKTIGPNVPKYSQSLITNSSGVLSLNNMEWDTYTVTPTDSTYDLVGVNPLNPIALSPGSTQSIQLIAVPKNSNTLLVTVKDSATGLPLSGATVEVVGPNPSNSYDQTQLTGQGYFNQTDWSHGATQTGLFLDPSAYALGNNVDTSTSTGNILLWNDITDPYNVGLTGQLDSSVFDTGTTSVFSVLSWNPGSQSPLTGTTSVRLQFASSPSSTPSVWNFFGPDGTANTYYTTPNSTISSINNTNEYGRYRVYLTTETATATPIISSVSTTYTSGCIPPGQVMFSGLQSGATYTVNISASGYTTTSVTASILNNWQVSQVSLQKIP